MISSFAVIPHAAGNHYCQVKSSMNLTGQYRIPAPPEAVWIALHDPNVLSSSIPGCEAIEKLSETSFKAKVLVKIGPVRARFEGKVELSPHPSVDGAPYAATLTGEGQGGAAGFAKGSSEVVLLSDGDGTELRYDAKATVGGRLAQIGQRLIDSAAKSLADEFFAKFVALMQPVTPVHTEASGAALHTHHANAASLGQTDPSREEGLAPEIWVAGLIGIIIILLIVFSILF